MKFKEGTTAGGGLGNITGWGLAGKQLCWKRAVGLGRAQAGYPGSRGRQQHPGVYQQHRSQLMREGIISLYSALLRHHIEHWVQCWGHQKKDFNTLFMRTFKMQNRLPREVLQSSYLKVFSCMKPWSDLIADLHLLLAGGWTTDLLRVLPASCVLWFCNSVNYSLGE